MLRGCVVDSIFLYNKSPTKELLKKPKWVHLKTVMFLKIFLWKAIKSSIPLLTMIYITKFHLKPVLQSVFLRAVQDRNRLIHKSNILMNF